MNIIQRGKVHISIFKGVASKSFCLESRRTFRVTLYSNHFALELTTLTQIKVVISSPLSLGHRTQKMIVPRRTMHFLKEQAVPDA